MRLTRLLLTIGLLLLATTATAQQVIITPTSAFAWGPSADHNATTVTGQPVLTAYELGIFTRTQAQSANPCPAAPPVGTPIIVNAGKPAPVAGTITSIPIATMPALTIDQWYCGYIRAVGPGGNSALVSPAGPFVRPGPIPVPAAPTTLTITP